MGLIKRAKYQSARATQLYAGLTGSAQIIKTPAHILYQTWSLMCLYFIQERHIADYSACVIATTYVQD